MLTFYFFCPRNLSSIDHTSIQSISFLTAINHKVPHRNQPNTMSELPATYKACVYDEPGKISTKVVELDMPEPGAGEVLINL